MTERGRDALLVGLACLACYANSLQGSFHYDDVHSLVENPAIRSLANVPAFFADPSLFSGEPGKAMYRPLLLVTYALNYALHGYDVVGWHVVNLGLHVVCSLLVLALGRGLLSERWTDARTARRAGLIAGLLFAVHPLATEPVNYISSRSETLAACFYLGTVLLHQGTGPERRHRGAATVACYAVGLLAKSVVITAPLALALHDLWQRRALRLRTYAPLAGVAVGYLALVWSNGFLSGSLAAPVRPWGVQLLTQAKAAAFYAGLLAVPHGLNVEHGFAAASGGLEATPLAGVLLVVSLAAVAWAGRGSVAAFCLAWCAIVVLPSTLMPLNVLVNERRLYLALAGLAWFGGYAGVRLRRPWPGVAVLLVLAVLTVRRNADWRDELTLWRDAVRQAPRMPRAQTNLGKARQLAGDAAGARQAYLAAIALDPRTGDAYNNLATLAHQRAASCADPGQRERLLEEAIGWYGEAIARLPERPEVHQNLADAQAERGDLDAAAASYARALALDPTRAATWTNYGQTLYLAGRTEEAEGAFLRAIELDAGLPEPYNNLGNVHVRRGELPQAIVRYRQALERSPRERTQVLANLADTQRQLGDLAAARQTVAEAMQADAAESADSVAADILLLLGRIERQAGHADLARAALSRAIERDGAQVRARIEYGELLAEADSPGEAAAQFGAATRLDSTSSRAWFGLAESLEGLNQRPAAAAAYRRFLSLWPHADRRRQAAAAALSRLEGGP